MASNDIFPDFSTSNINSQVPIKNIIEANDLFSNNQYDIETLNPLVETRFHSIAAPLNEDQGKPKFKITPQLFEKNDYVNLPFYEFNKMEDGKTVLWDVIFSTLTTLSETFEIDVDPVYVENAIKSYNKQHRLRFENLEIICDKFKRKIGSDYLKKVLNQIIFLVLETPQLFPKPIRFLKTGMFHSVTLSQHQCACLLANSFFCTFTDRMGNLNPENMPFINFDCLYDNNSKNNRSRVKLEKLKCIFHYFDRITQRIPTGLVTFTRQAIQKDNIPELDHSKTYFRKVIILDNGTIEDCTGALQADFANKYLGGGVLNSGCVQEEIRFLICPELIVSQLITERMLDNESVIIKGCERFSNYKGYASSFKFDGNYIDHTPRDRWGRLYTHVIAMDALFFRDELQQFKKAKIDREVTKCMAAFQQFNLDSSLCPSNQLVSCIATGNWGCGAFRGNKQLKFIIQFIVAAETNRDLVYFTFNDLDTKSELEEIASIIKSNRLTTSHVYNLIVYYSDKITEYNNQRSASSRKFPTILEYMRKWLNQNNVTTIKSFV